MDMTQFGNILQKCRNLSISDSDWIKKLDTLALDMSQETFNVCIVGGFSHGKTHLLNELLGTDVFPENVLPTTTVLTRVSYGEKTDLVFKSGAEKTDYEFCRENLDLFCAGNAREDAVGILSVHFPGEFLKPATVIEDTPGLDDLLTTRADITFAALENCDAALVVVSAIAPLSLNEKTFIESYLARRAIPKIAMVITFLDKLNPRQMDKQLDYISQISRASWPGIEIWTSMGLQDAEKKKYFAGGPEAMRKRIQAWAVDPNLEKQRAKHFCARLATILNEALSENRTLLANLESDRAAREKKLRKAIENLSESAQGWQELRREFMDRGADCAKTIQETLGGKADKIYNLSLKDSRQSFEASLRLNLQSLVAEISQDLQQSLNDDMENLLADIRSMYGIEPLLRQESLEISPDYTQISLPGNNPVQNIFEQIKGLDNEIVEKIVVFLPVPPIARPIIRQIAHWLLDFGKSLLENNPDEHEDKIKAEIDKFLSSLEGETLRLIELLYGHVAEQVRNEQDMWLKKQKHALETANTGHETSAKMIRYQENMAQLRSLLEMLRQ